MQNVESYGEALDPSEADMVKILKKPLEGLQNAKFNFLKRVATFYDVYAI